MTKKTVSLGDVARVEGDARIELTYTDGEFDSSRVFLTEEFRRFERLLVGRHYSEVPAIVGRICGICPVSHYLGAAIALEDALGITPTPQTVRLRDALSWAQLLQSHVLHVITLAGPDYVGETGLLGLAQNHPERVQDLLRMRQVANDIVETIGGNPVQPANIRVGGFGKAPDGKRLQSLAEELQDCWDAVWNLVSWVARFELPDLSSPMPQLAVYNGKDYPLLYGDWRSTLDYQGNPREYREYVSEFAREDQGARTSLDVEERALYVGPLARLVLNKEHLNSAGREAADRLFVPDRWRNPYYSVRARTIETAHGVAQLAMLLHDIDPVDEPLAPATSSGFGASLTEAPRGTLYHGYRVDEAGTVEFADIVTPTAHNIAAMEHDIDALIRILEPTQPDPEPDPASGVRLEAERLLRTYDPCFSCATHFVTLEYRMK